MDHCFLLTNPNAEISIGMKKTMDTRTSRRTNVEWDGASGNSTGKNLLLASHNSRFRVSLQQVTTMVTTMEAQRSTSAQAFCPSRSAAVSVARKPLVHPSQNKCRLFNRPVDVKLLRHVRFVQCYRLLNPPRRELSPPKESRAFVLRSFVVSARICVRGGEG
jgi:hypothetical protein